MCPASPTLGGGGGHTPGPRSEIRDSDEQSLRGGRGEPGQGAAAEGWAPPGKPGRGNPALASPQRTRLPAWCRRGTDRRGSPETPRCPPPTRTTGSLGGGQGTVAPGPTPALGGQAVLAGALPAKKARPRRGGGQPEPRAHTGPWSQPWRLRLVTSRPRSPRRGPTAGEPAASAPSARTAPAWRAARAEVGGGVGATAPATPRPRRPSRAGPRRGPGPCSRPAAARSSASGFGSVLAGGGSAEGNVEGQTERDRPGDERSRTEPRDVSVPSSHARKEARGRGRGGRGEQRGGVCSWRGP